MSSEEELNVYASIYVKQFNQRTLKDGVVSILQVVLLQMRSPHLGLNCIFLEKMRSLVAVLQISCDRGMK